MTTNWCQGFSKTANKSPITKTIISTLEKYPSKFRLGSCMRKGRYIVEERILIYTMMIKRKPVDIHLNFQRMAETSIVENTIKCLMEYLLKPPSPYSVKKLVASPAKTKRINTWKIMLDWWMVTSTFLSLEAEVSFEFKTMVCWKFNENRCIFLHFWTNFRWNASFLSSFFWP